MVTEGYGPLRDVLCRALHQDDRFNVVGTAGTGDEAVSFDAPFDLAVVDLGIGGLGSLVTVARLRERTPSPAVVVLSASDAIYLRFAAAAHGAAGFLVMPDDLNHLPDRLARLLVPEIEPRAPTNGDLPAPVGTAEG